MGNPASADIVYNLLARRVLAHMMRTNRSNSWPNCFLAICTCTQCSASAICEILKYMESESECMLSLSDFCQVAVHATNRNQNVYRYSPLPRLLVGLKSAHVSERKISSTNIPAKCTIHCWGWAAKYNSRWILKISAKRETARRK